MSGLNSIVQVDISIESPVIDSTSFDYMLIVGPAPKVAPQEAPNEVAAYSSLTEVTEAGWIATGNNADPIGIAARIAFSQSPKPNKVYIAVQQQDEETSDLESVEKTLNRALGINGWYVICPAGIETSEYEKIAEWTEAQNKVFAFTSLAVDPGFNVKEFYRTFWIFGRETTSHLSENVPAANNYLHVAWVAKSLNYDSGSETWSFKSLSGVNPSRLSTADVNTIESNGGNHYTTVAGKNITRPGKVYAGEWIDTIRFRDWLQNDMQVRIFNLFVTNPKVPYTDKGISLVENQIVASLKTGQTAGGIAETQYDEDNKEIPGYTVTVPKASSITASQRASRKLEGCKFTARLAGAIHVVEIKGTLVN